MKAFALLAMLSLVACSSGRVMTDHSSLRRSPSSVETSYFKTKVACINSVVRVAGGDSLDEFYKDAEKLCSTALEIELQENEGAIEAMRKGPAGVGCRLGAHYVLRGNNKDATPEMIKQMVAGKCK